MGQGVGEERGEEEEKKEEKEEKKEEREVEGEKEVRRGGGGRRKEEEEEEGGGGRRREMGTDASLPGRAGSMLRSLTILPAESSDLIATLRLKSHYLYFAKAAPCSE